MWVDTALFLIGGDPDSIGTVNPDPDSESGSGQVRMTPKKGENKKPYGLRTLRRAGGISWSLDVLYRDILIQIIFCVLSVSFFSPGFIIKETWAKSG